MREPASGTMRVVRSEIDMPVISTSPFQDLLDRIDRLPIGDQEALHEIVRRSLTERRMRLFWLPQEGKCWPESVYCQEMSYP